MTALRAFEDAPDKPTPAFEEVDCNLCGSSEQIVLFDAGADGRVVRCGSCGLGFVSPRPVDVSAQYEGDDYFSSGTPSDPAGSRGSPTPRGYEAYLADRGALGEYFGRILDDIQRRRRGRPRGRLLEVGCAAGFFLDEARARGYEVAGIEPSPTASAVAREQLRLPVRTGLLGEVDIEHEAWDVIVLLQTIEHLPDPAAALSELRRVLRPGGLLLLTTPDEASWLRRVMGRRWIGYKPPEHLWHFNARTLSGLLLRQGFTDVEVRRDVHRYPPRWLMRRGAHYFPRLAPIVRATELVTPGALLDGYTLPVHWGSIAAWATRPATSAAR